MIVPFAIREGNGKVRCGGWPCDPLPILAIDASNPALHAGGYDNHVGRAGAGGLIGKV